MGPAVKTPAAKPSITAHWRFPNEATPQGTSAYYSLRFSSPDLRDGLASLVAWRYLVRGILQEVRDPGVARLKLQWWREELAGMAEGRSSHPLSVVLRPLVDRHRLPLEPFLRMARQVEDEILGRPTADAQSLQLAGDADLGALFELMTRVHGITDPEILAEARSLGTFSALVYRIRDSGWLARQGRSPVPLDWLRAAGIDADALRQGSHRARLPEWLAEMAHQALRVLAQCPDFSHLPPCVRIRTRILATLLHEMEAISFQLAEQRLSLTPLRKLWIAWRES